MASLGPSFSVTGRDPLTPACCTTVLHMGHLLRLRAPQSKEAVGQGGSRGSFCTVPHPCHRGKQPSHCPTGHLSCWWSSALVLPLQGRASWLELGSCHPLPQSVSLDLRLLMLVSSHGLSLHGSCSPLVPRVQQRARRLIGTNQVCSGLTVFSCFPGPHSQVLMAGGSTVWRATLRWLRPCGTTGRICRPCPRPPPRTCSPGQSTTGRQLR